MHVPTGCFTTAKRKEEVRQAQSVDQQRDEALLAKGSYVSDSVIRIYFLDGNYRAIYYDAE
jgi:hypothetical protein